MVFGTLTRLMLVYIALKLLI